MTYSGYFSSVIDDLKTYFGIQGDSAVITIEPDASGQSYVTVKEKSTVDSDTLAFIAAMIFVAVVLYFLFQEAKR